MSQAAKLLGLPAGSTSDEAKTRWRELASVHHPDRGGDAATFDALRKAYITVLQECSEPKHCAVCQGTGKISHSLGFSSVATFCVYCNGVGVKP